MKCPKCKGNAVRAICDGEGAWFCMPCQQVFYKATETDLSRLKGATPPDTLPEPQKATAANVVPTRGIVGTMQRYNKYGNVRTERDGITFASKKEADRYSELCMMEAAGEISGITLQVRHDLFVNGVKICAYFSDFEYMMDGRMVVEDAKGMKTRTYIIKRKLMKAIYGIDIQEV